MDIWHASTLIGVLLLLIVTAPGRWPRIPYMIIIGLGLVFAFTQPLGPVLPLFQAKQLTASRFVITCLLFRLFWQKYSRAS